MITYDDFVAFEENSYKCIKLNPQYVDITGDVLAGLLLSQIVYWNLPSKKNGSKRCGDYLIKKREDWYDEIRLTPRQIDRVMKILIAKGIVDVKVQKSVIYNGTPVHHIRLNIDILVELINKHLHSSMVVSTSPNGEVGISTSPNGEISLSTSPNGDVTSPNGEVDFTKRGNLLIQRLPSETITEITQPIQLVGTGGNPVVDSTKAAEVIAIQEERHSFSNKDKYLPGDCSSVAQNSSISHDILDSIEPACSAYFGSYYPTARSFFESMTITSADHATKLATLQKTVFEKYPVDIVKVVIATIRQWESHGDLEYYNPVYFLRALEEENEMQYVYTKFKQFCMEYFSTSEDALEVYHFYITVLKSKEDMRSAHAKEGVPLHERRINNVKALVEKQGLIEFINMIRHYSQEYKLGKLRCAPSIARFSNYFETYTKNKSNKSKQKTAQKTASAPISNSVPETTIRKIAATPYERIGSKYNSEKWEYCNWSYQCECGEIFEYWTEVCPSCSTSISQAASRDKFFSMFRICTCGKILHETDKTCPQCKMEFIIETAIGRLEKKLKNNERESKDEHGATARVCQDAEH